MSRRTLSRGTHRATTPHQRPITLLALAATAAAASLYSPAARAADGTWIGTASGNYSDPAQWSGGTIADGAGSAANFATVDPLADLTVTLDTPRTLGSLSFADTDPATAASWIVAGANPLTLAGPSTPTITVDTLGTGKEVRIDAQLVGTLGFIKNGTGTLHLNNNANNLTVTGATINAGTVSIGSGNSSTGTNNITNPLGAAGTTVTLNGGTISNALGANPTATLQNNFTVNANATVNMGSRMVFGQSGTGNTRTVTLNNGANLTFTLNTTVSRDDIYTAFAIGAAQPTPTVTFNGSGSTRLFINGGFFNGFTNMNLVVDGSANLNPQTNSGGNTINVGSLSGPSQTASLGGGSAGAPTYSVGALGTSSTFAGGVSGNAALTKVGTGTLVLTNNNGGLSATGAFTVSAGTLQVDGNKTGSGNTVVNSGGTLAGNGTLAGTVTVNAGGHVAPGTATSVGTLTLSSLTLQPGSFIDTDFSTTGGNDSLISTGTLTINGGSVNLFNEGGTTPFSTNGTYNLITFSSIAGLGVGGLGVANPQSGKTYTFATSGNFVTLAISSAGGPVYWNKSTGGTWAANGNWTNSFPNGQGAFAGFGGGGTALVADATVTLDGNKTVGTLSLNSAKSFTIAPGTGGALTLDNGSTSAAITDAAGSHTISAPVNLSTTGNDVNVVSAADALTLAGALSGSGAVNKVGAGTLVLAAASPNFTGSFNPAAGNTQIADANALQSATLNGGAGTLSTSLPSLNVGRLGTGAIAFASATQIPVGADGSSSTFAGSLSGPVTLVKQSSGTLSLTGNNSLTGGIVVNGGVLDIQAVQSATGGVALNNGATLQFNTNSSLPTDVTASNNSLIHLLPTGLSGSASIFPGFNTILPAGATATVNSEGLGNGIGGTVTGDASTTLVVQNNTSFNATAASANPKQFANMLGTVRVEGTLRFSATSLNNGGDNTSFNLNGGTLTTRNGGPVSLGELTGNGTLQGAASADGNATYTIGLKGTSFTFAGTFTDAANRANNIVKSGTGTMTLAGADNRANNSATTVNAGTLQLGSDAALSSNSRLILNTGGTLDLNAHNLTAQSIAGTNGTLLLSANLSLNGSTDTSFAGSIVGTGALSKDGPAAQTVGSIDAPTVTVTAGRLALAGTTASRISNLTVSAAPLQLNSRLVLPTMSQNDATTLVLMGRNTGTWDGVAGITTTADTHHGIAITTVATLGTAAFPNLAGLTGSETLLVGTWYGDLNLDGKVNADDYVLMDRGFAKHLTGWINGDLNYDNVIDAGDYFLLDSTYAAAGVPHDAWTALLSQRESQFGAEYVSQLVASVPEPTTLSLLAIGALPLAARRRRATP